MTDTFDLLLTGGTVIDPSSSVNQKLDLGMTGDRIAAIGSNIPPVNAKRVLNVDGCIVTPGLIDFHVHSYWGVNPYGFNADPVCLATGVTTTMDAGSSGPVNFLGFRKLVYEQSRARMLAFVAMAQHGVLNDPGELENLRFADSEGAAQVVAENPDVAIGIKVRMHKKAVGENSREALRLAVKAGEACRAPVMVHVGDTAISMEEIVDSLRTGDIVTHCYTPQQPSIIDKNGRLLDAVRKAQARGVIFDVGHAGGHFDFDLVRRAIDDGLLPDIISSDLHGRLKQPGFGIIGDLPTVMTKFLVLGLSLERIIAACTISPARAIGWQDRLGSLKVGSEADIAVLEVVSESVNLHDSVGGKMTAQQRIAPRWTIRGGEVFAAKG
jgi:dihydroorotase